MKQGRRGTLLSRLLGGLIVMATLAVTLPASAEDAIDRILSAKQLKIGYIPSPPGTIKDPATGNVGGFYVDAIRLVAKQMGVEPVFIETTWANFPAGLNSGQFDISIAGTFATIGRATAVAFTKPIWYLGYSAVVKKGDTRFETLADMDKPGIKIAVTQGGAGQEFAKEFFKNAELVSLATGNLAAVFVEVTAGRVDVGIEDAWTARRYSAEHPEVTNLFADHPYNLLPISWSVKKGNQEMLNFLNTAIDYLLSTGRWEKMAEPYGPNGRYKVTYPLEVFGPKK